MAAKGDLAIDAHHTVEDTGILVGAALGEALGNKAGVRRFASIRVPLDEAVVEAVLDLSGRPFLHYEIDPPGEKILGDPPFDPQLMEEFWRAVVGARRHDAAPDPGARPQHAPHRRGVGEGDGAGPARRGAHRGRRGAVDQGVL